MKCPNCNKEVVFNEELDIKGIQYLVCPKCKVHLVNTLKVQQDNGWNSIRTQAAIAAMQALIGILDNVYDRNLISTPKLAVEFADALIAELRKGE